MQFNFRNLFPYAALSLILAALGYAVSFGTFPPADFTFVNETEIQSIDPAIVTGVPEGRILRAIFEGLYQRDPKTLVPLPALAERHEISDDLKTYTFYLRRGCVWSDGTPINAHDFLWSWQRFLHPETAAEYSYQLYYLRGAKKYNTSQVEIGDLVEVELADRPAHASGRRQLFPRGTVLHGTLLKVVKPKRPDFESIEKKEEREKAEARWRKRWVYHVRIDGSDRRFSKDRLDGAEQCEHVLLDFSQVGVKVLDDYTLQVELNDPTPYFLQLMAFYPMFPVNRACVEKYGSPDWTKAENIVTSGPYLLEDRRLRDRIRLVKNPDYWNADNIQLEVIDALAVNSNITGLNLYLNGQADWITVVPYTVVSMVKDRKDFSCEPMFTTYYYRINVTRKGFDNKLVRQALNRAVDKQEICDAILQAGQIPARALVPPIEGYESSQCGDFDPEAAKRLLAQAGYPGGKGFPPFKILYNTDEAHAIIAQKLQSDWKKHLGIDVEIQNLEWGVYQDTMRTLDYSVARYAWVADYADPNTFLDMFVTGGENNQTGWGNPRYDELIEQASKQPDPEERAKTLHAAEAILMEEQPIIPIYFYVSRNMVRPYVYGFYPNIEDVHPLRSLRIDPAEKKRFLKSRGLR